MTCLHYLARRADPQTAAIFLRAVQDGSIDYSDLDTRLVDRDGLTARDLLNLRGHDEVRHILEAAMVLIETEVASEKSSRSNELEYIDAFELLPQLEKDVGVERPMVTVREIIL